MLLLLKNGTDASLKNNKLETSLHLAARYGRDMNGNLKLNAINVVCDVITFAILSGEKQPLNQSDTKLELTKNLVKNLFALYMLSPMS